MPARVVHVTAASRLHFGLISLGGHSARAFGGVGVMVQPPNIRLRISPAAEFSALGPGAARVVEFVAGWQRLWGFSERPACRLEIESLPRMHVGLGVGTQLGLSVAMGLNAFWQMGEVSPIAVTQCVGRGLRSAVGTHGFFHGGLILELGKTPEESVSPLARRVVLPTAWRFVLMCLREGEGLYGTGEQQAFASLPAVPAEICQALQREASEHMLPAAEAGDFHEFSESVYRFGYQSGSSFAAVQGGAYNGPQLTQLVNHIRSLGVGGVGQSSWGPTLFAVCRDQIAARKLAASLADENSLRQADIWIAEPCNHGALIEVEHC